MEINADMRCLCKFQNVVDCTTKPVVITKQLKKYTFTINVRSYVNKFKRY